MVWYDMVGCGIKLCGAMQFGKYGIAACGMASMVHQGAV